MATVASNSYARVDEEVLLRGKRLRSRVYLPAHQPGLADDGLPGDRYVDYHRRRARAGLGMQITGATPVLWSEVWAGGLTLVNIDDRIIPGYRRLAAAVAEGGLMLAQLAYVGAMETTGDAIISASWTHSEITQQTSREATSDELAEIADLYRAAALRCRAGDLDGAEANLCEALHCDDSRRRDAVSMFMLRNTQRAAKRGYAVAASAASLEVGFDDRASAQTVVFRWGGGDSAREMETIERDEEKISVPRYGDGRGDACLEGEVATPAVLIEHAAAVVSEPEPESEPVQAQPALPAWPGPYPPPPLFSISTSRSCRRRGLRRHALDDDRCWQDHRTRGRPRTSEQSWQRPDKAGDSADCCRSTTGWRARDTWWRSNVQRRNRGRTGELRMQRLTIKGSPDHALPTASLTQ